jgi:hypothetical protein
VNIDLARSFRKWWQYWIFALPASVLIFSVWMAFKSIKNGNMIGTMQSRYKISGMGNLEIPSHFTPPGPSLAPNSKAISGRKKRKQATHVRSQQAFWAALASTKAAVLKEMESGLAANDATEANAPHDKYESSDNSSEWNEELRAAEAQLNTPVLYMERREDFLRNSEALEEFREGLLDFSIAMENAARNRMNAHQEAAPSMETRIFDALKRVHMNWKMFWGFLRKVTRPSVKPGMERIEWICVSGPHH